MAGSAEERNTANRTWDLPSLKGMATLAAAATVASKKDSVKKNEDTNATPEPPREIATTLRPADAPLEADDPGRPQLRRGRPEPRVTSSANIETGPAAANSVTVGAAAEAVATPGTDGDPVIAKAREAAQGYAASLPNFLVKQLTTRYSSDNPKRGWDAQDTTSADVTYENGTQTYANVKVGNRAVKSMEESGGSWSTGEFATWMEGLLGPSARARFRRTNTDTIQKRSAIAYKFEVPRERSNWRVAVDAQIYYPAFRGTVWFDSATSRVLRIEAEARGIPPLFPDDKVETAIDYDFVRLAATQSFLLPTAAEVLACQMGTTYCSRNRIEFRNYRKFGSESGVSFDDVGADKPKQ